MKEELIEYFYWEQPGDRKREAEDDDKANIWSHYGERNVDHPTLAVISNESEKSKEQKDETTAKTISFDSWKEDSSFLGPKKENRKIAAKLLFNFDGNTAKEENIPFNHGIQFSGLGAVGGN